MATAGVVTKPNPQDSWEPTNGGLWDRVLDLSQGKLKTIQIGEKTYHAPRDGQGFKKFPTPRATGWCVRIYNLAGGRWRRKGEARMVLLTGNMVERVAERHQTKLAKMLGEDIRRSMCRYQEGPSHDWKSCHSCSHWTATASQEEAKTRPGVCLKQTFVTIELGWCPAHLSLEE